MSYKDELDFETLKARFEPILEAELHELKLQSLETAEDRAPVELDQQSVGRLSRMDAMQIQAMAQQREQRRQQRINQIHAALRRIENEEYGDCAACGHGIGIRRLEADPTARLCIGCAQKSRG